MNMLYTCEIVKMNIQEIILFHVAVCTKWLKKFKCKCPRRHIRAIPFKNTWGGGGGGGGGWGGTPTISDPLQ